MKKVAESLVRNYFAELMLRRTLLFLDDENSKVRQCGPAISDLACKLKEIKYLWESCDEHSFKL